MRKLFPLVYFLFLFSLFLMLIPDVFDLGGIMLSKRLAAFLILWLALLPSVLLAKQYSEPAWQSALYELLNRSVRMRVRMRTVVFMAITLLFIFFLFLSGIFKLKNWQDIISAFLIYFCSCPLFVRFFQPPEGPFHGEFGNWLYDNKSEILKKGKADFRGIPITAETRVVKYNSVLSYALMTKPFESPFILVDQQRVYSFLTLVLYSFLTFVFGWWNIPKGVTLTVRAILSNLKGGSVKTVGGVLGRLHDQAVLIHLKLSSEGSGEEEIRERIQELGGRLEALAQKADVGDYDGDEYGNGEYILYFYGGNADKLFAVLEPTLLLSPLSKGGFAIKQYGESNRSKKVKITF